MGDRYHKYISLAPGRMSYGPYAYSHGGHEGIVYCHHCLGMGPLYLLLYCLADYEKHFTPSAIHPGSRLVRSQASQINYPSIRTYLSVLVCIFLLPED